MVEELKDPRRVEPPPTAPEREMLEAWLDFHRITLLLKCEGLSDADRKRRPVESSLMSLHGLIRHMADVERNWFQRVLASDPDLESMFWTPARPDADFELVDEAEWEDDLGLWQSECETSRRIAAQHDLDDVGAGRTGRPFSLRWILVHMVEEYARHNGHADLLREMIDGAVGD